MASPTQCTWVWVNSGSRWWTGSPGTLQSMGSQRVRHDWVTELNWTDGPGLSTTILISFIRTLRPRGAKECDFRQPRAETDPRGVQLFTHGPFTDTETKACKGSTQPHTSPWTDIGSGPRLSGPSSDALHCVLYHLPTQRGSQLRWWLPECDKGTWNLGFCSDHSARGAQREVRKKGVKHPRREHGPHTVRLWSVFPCCSWLNDSSQPRVTFLDLNPQGSTEIPRAPFPQRPGVT